MEVFFHGQIDHIQVDDYKITVAPKSLFPLVSKTFLISFLFALILFTTGAMCSGFERPDKNSRISCKYMNPSKDSITSFGNS